MTIKERVETILVIYLLTTVLGLAMSLIAWDSHYVIIVPALVGTMVCYVSGLFGKPFGLGVPDVSEERV